MTPARAKRIVEVAMIELGLTSKLTARTISFEDLARESMVFVTIHEWPPIHAQQAHEIAALARSHGFRVTFPQVFP